jgi:multiple sugar transport system substrate-binding protein
MPTRDDRDPVQHLLRGTITRRRFVGRSLAVGLSLGAAGAVFGTSGVAAGQPTEPEYTGPAVELAFWNGFAGPNGRFLLQLIDQFNAAHANIKVGMVATPWVEYYQKVPQAVASGEGPDLGIMHIDALALNAARGVITPLDDLAQEVNLDANDFAPVVWDAGVFREQRYGIPLDVHPLGLYYNKGVMQQAGLDPNAPPTTRDALMAALERLKAGGVRGYWLTPLAVSSWHFQSLLWQHGGSPYNEDVTAATWNSDAGVEALTWMTDLVKAGHSPESVGEDADVIAFQNNENAFHVNGVWMINSFKESAQESGLQWGVAPLPQIGEQPAVWANSHNFVLMTQRRADDNRRQAAKAFIGWMITNSALWAQAGQVPASNTVRNDPAFQGLPEQQVFASQLPSVRFPPAATGVRQIQTETIDVAVNEAILLQKEPKQALDEAASRADQLLAEYRGRYQG